jgi:sulfur carrier protein ThiS
MKVNISLLGFLPKPKEISIMLEGEEITIEYIVKKVLEESEDIVRERLHMLLEREDIPSFMVIASGVTVPREKWCEYHVKDGDNIAILSLLVGGG